MFLLYGPWGILGFFIPVLYFFHLGFGPLRFVPHTAILGTVFSAFLISHFLIRSKESKSRIKSGLTTFVVIVLLSGLFLGGMLNLYASPYNMIPSGQTTRSEISGMGFLFEYRNNTIPVSGLTAAPGRFADLLLTPEEKAGTKYSGLVSGS